jgi:hypothetical protein
MYETHDKRIKINLYDFIILLKGFKKIKEKIHSKQLFFSLWSCEVVK